MKRFLLIFCMTSLLFACTNKPQVYIPGSYKALNLATDARAFPNKNIPAGAYTSAFEEHQLMSPLPSLTKNPVEWEAMGPWNTAGRTLAVAFHPTQQNTLFAGTASGGLWKSTEMGLGTSWERVDLGHPVLGVSSIEISTEDPDVIFIGTGEVYNYSSTGTDAAYRSTRGSWGMGILKSSDGGNTWEKSLDWSYQQEHGVWMIKIDPNHSDIVFANTTEGVYRSTNAGEDWELVLDVIMGTDIEINPENSDEIVAAFGNFGTEGKGIYKSSDGGDSWVNVNNAALDDFNGKTLLAYAPSQPSTIYASVGNGFWFDDGATTLMRSTNFGSTWEVVNNTDYSKWQGWFSHDIAVNPQDAEQLIAVGIETWQSNDGGQTLTQITSGGVTGGTPPIEEPDGPGYYVHSDQHFVLYHPSIEDLAVIGSDGGLFLTMDNGLNWRSINGGLQTTQFYNGFSVSRNGFEYAMGGLQDNNTVIYRGDKAWQRAIGGDGSWTAINHDDEDVVFGSWQNLNVQRSNNMGQSFSSVSFKENDDNPLFISPYGTCQGNGNLMYACGNYVYFSNNTGLNWQTTNSGQKVSNDPIFSLGIAPSDCDVVYVGTAPKDFDAKIYRTTDRGDTWSDVTNELPNRYPNDIAVDPLDDSVVYACFSGFGTGHVFRSSDAGETWEDISFNLPDLPTNAIAIDHRNTNMLYVGNDFGVYAINLAEDQEWYKWSESLPDVVIAMDLKIDPLNEEIWIATHGNGSYKRSLPELTIKNDDLVLGDNDLSIFPNPANDQTTLSLTEGRIKSYRIFAMDGSLIKAQSNLNHEQIIVDLSTISAHKAIVQVNGEISKILIMQH